MKEEGSPNASFIELYRKSIVPLLNPPFIKTINKTLRLEALLGVTERASKIIDALNKISPVLEKINQITHVAESLPYPVNMVATIGSVALFCQSSISLLKFHNNLATLHNNLIKKMAGMAYSTVILSLAVSTLIFPPAAPALFLSIAAIGTGYAAFNVGKFVFKGIRSQQLKSNTEKYKKDETLIQLNKELNKAKTSLLNAHNKEQDLDEKLRKAKKDSPEMSKILKEMQQVKQEFDKSKKAYSEVKGKIEAHPLSKKIAQNEKKQLNYQSKLQTMKLVDAGVSATLGATTTTALALSLTGYGAAIGGPLFIGSLAVGATYISARVGQGLIQGLLKKDRADAQEPPKEPSPIEKKQTEPLDENKKTPPKRSIIHTASVNQDKVDLHKKQSVKIKRPPKLGSLPDTVPAKPTAESTQKKSP